MICSERIRLMASSSTMNDCGVVTMPADPNIHVIDVHQHGERVHATFVGKKRKMWVVADFDPGRNWLYEHDDPTIIIRYAGFEEHVAEKIRREEGGQLIETEAD